MFREKKETFDTCGLNQSIDICVAKNHFIKDKRGTSKLIFSNYNKVTFFLGQTKKERVPHKMGQREYIGRSCSLLTAKLMNTGKSSRKCCIKFSIA